jgi:hypothetical protein
MTIDLNVAAFVDASGGSAATMDNAVGVAALAAFAEPAVNYALAAQRAAAAFAAILRLAVSASFA